MHIAIGLVTVMFGATGTLLNTSKRLQNQGKVRRSSRALGYELIIILCALL